MVENTKVCPNLEKITPDGYLKFKAKLVSGGF